MVKRIASAVKVKNVYRLLIEMSCGNITYLLPSHVDNKKKLLSWIEQHAKDHEELFILKSIKGRI